MPFKFSQSTAAILLGAVALAVAQPLTPRADETAIPPEAIAYRDITYAAPAGVALKLDLFTPPGNGPWPTVLWFHGGAWKMGSRSGWPHMMFLLRQGYAVANVDYRLTPTAPYPAQLDDCVAALDYLAQHAEAYKLDASKFAATGESAGGHLAALLGLARGPASRASGPGRVHAVVDLFGPTDLPGLAELGPQWADVLAQFAGGDLAAHSDVLKSASPIDQVTPGAPPFLIFHGDQDPLVPIAQSRQLVARLKQAGDRVEFIPVPGAGHATQQFWTEAYQQKMIVFLNETFGIGSVSK